MAGKVDIYNLGEKGVNLVRSPIHKQDGELTTAQNAQIIPYHAQRALGKRRGMSLINVTTAAAGAILNLFRVSLSDPDSTDVDVTPTGTLLLFIPWNASFPSFHRFSPDAPDLTSASWINISEGYRNAGYPGEQNRIFRLPANGLPSNGRIFWYPATADGRRWEQYDADTDTTASAFTLPATGPNGSSIGQVGSYCTDDTSIYVSVLYGGTGSPIVVYKCDLDGTVAALGEYFSASSSGTGIIKDDYAGAAITMHYDRLVTCGVDSTSYATFEATLYSIDPASGSAWTLEAHKADLVDEFGTYWPTCYAAGEDLYCCYLSFTVSPVKQIVLMCTYTFRSLWTVVYKADVTTTSNATINTMRMIAGAAGYTGVSRLLLADGYRLLDFTDPYNITTVSTYSQFTYHTDAIMVWGDIGIPGGRPNRWFYATWSLETPWKYTVYEISLDTIDPPVATEITSKSVTTALRAFLLGGV